MKDTMEENSIHKEKWQYIKINLTTNIRSA
jgi:hypothetical protein